MDQNLSVPQLRVRLLSLLTRQRINPQKIPPCRELRLPPHFRVTDIFVEYSDSFLAQLSCRGSHRSKPGARETNGRHNKRGQNFLCPASSPLHVLKMPAARKNSNALRLIFASATSHFSTPMKIRHLRRILP